MNKNFRTSIVICLLWIAVSVVLVSCEHSKIFSNSIETTSPQASASISATQSPSSGDACSHIFGDWTTVQSASCIQEGLKRRSCTACGVSEEAPIGKNNAHREVVDKAIPATCKSTGVTEGRYCMDCNRVLKEPTVLPKTDHQYVGSVCKDCGHTGTPTFTPDYSASQVNTIGNTAGNSPYTSQGDWIYFTSTGQQLSKFKKNGTSVVSIYKISEGNIQSVSVIGDWIYFSVRGSSDATSYIGKVRTDGSSFGKIVSSVRIGEMLVIKDTVFYTTIKTPYTNYAKDCAPLYAISVNGGNAKQLHDGYVGSMVADDTHLYFVQSLKSGLNKIYRMKHDGTNLTHYYSSEHVNYITLANGSVYFLLSSDYESTYTIASFSTGGGSITTHGTIAHYSEWLYVYGNYVYYGGSVDYTPGVAQYNISTQKHTLIQENSDLPECYFVSNYIVLEKYTDSWMTDKKSVSLYNVQSLSWRTVSMP